MPTPAGAPFTQAMAHELAAEPHLIFACGRYEGIDQRVLDHAATRMPVSEVSLGDYVLFGGEVAVLVMLEAVTRLLPGVLGNADSLVEESHADGLLEAPVYTKPAALARATRCRRCCAPATTAGSPAGGATRRCCAPPTRRPDLLAALTRRPLDKRDVAALDGAGFQVPPGGCGKVVGLPHAVRAAWRLARIPTGVGQSTHRGSESPTRAPSDGAP